MSEFIKINGVWESIAAIYKKISGSWVLQEQSNGILDVIDRVVYFYQGHINNATLNIIGESQYTGKSFVLSCTFGSLPVNPTWSIISGNPYASINNNGKVTIEQGTINETIVVQASYRDHTETKTIVISYDNELIIEGPDTITGTSGNVIAKYNSNIVEPIWDLGTGNGIASIDSSGNITITESGTIVVEADYNGYTASKQIDLVYNVNSTTETTIDENGSVTTETTTTETDPETGSTTTVTTTTTTNEDGTSSSTTSETIENQDGSSTTTATTTNSDGTTTETTTNTSAPDENGSVTTTEQSTTTNTDGTSSSTTSTTTENEDGSSFSSSTTTNYDENGDATGSTTNQTTNNSDGSSSSTTTNYNENGDPTNTTNQNNDTNGNTSTQTIEYNDNGDPVVTGYNIDTSGSDDGTMNFDGAGGVNTNYYAFDMTHGFEMVLHFTIDFTAQPPGQSDNHHNIMAMKRQNSTPWYGFQIRQSSTNKYIQLGTQFSTGSNTNVTITATSANAISSNINEYNIKIVYDPTKATNSFICDELIGGYHVAYNGKFPDLDELKYIKLTVGCALDGNGDPYRFCNMDVLDFYIKKLHNIDNPVITCDGRNITITCATEDASIYYRLNQTGNYVEYSSPISINADTTIEAYSRLADEISDTITRTFEYDNGIEEPTISCNNNIVTITNNQANSTLYYRLDQSGSYELYTDPIYIYEDTIVQAYVQVGNEISDIVLENCLYDNGIENPVISCDGELVTISAADINAEIYYRLNETGSFILYEDAIEIFADTVVEAYAVVNNLQSHTTTETCVYAPIILSAPIIIFNGTEITIACTTQDASVFYKLNQTGSFVQYTTPIEILEDTFVETYSTLRGKQSTIVSQNCIYEEIHNYSNDYLTFEVLSDGQIGWTYINETNTANSPVNKTIQYSINNGEWISITSGRTSASAFSVSTGDIVRFKGTNDDYGPTTQTDTYRKSNCTFGTPNHSGSPLDKDTTVGEYTTAQVNISGNIMSLFWGDDFINHSEFKTNTKWQCMGLFKRMNTVVSAENLILPATILYERTYNALFSWATNLVTPPALPATTLGQYCYSYMFEECAITTSPDLLAEVFVKSCCESMFQNCRSLNYIKCMAISGMNTNGSTTKWTSGVASSGTFVKDSGVTVNTWGRGVNAIPTNWLVYDDVPVVPPTIAYDGFSTITLTCDTSGATIYYKLNNTGDYAEYSTPITISSDTVIQAYSSLTGQDSRVITQTCAYVSDVPLEASNRDLKKWNYNNQEVSTPYSVNAIDGHSASYAKGTFNFETSFALRTAQPAHLWFQHADQSASIYVDDVLVEKHWGGYTAFTVDISEYVHSGTNNIKVALKNNEGNYLAPASGDFNFNATLGNVKLLTSPVLPDINYGYDGFHIIASNVSQSSATIDVVTSIPVGATVVCTITDGTFNYTDTKPSTGEEMTFNTTITNPHLWNGTIDPHLYNVTLDIYYNNELYHTFTRPYGIRYFEYVINDTTILQNNDPYTGFLLNGSPYLLRGCCMHDDIDGKANALNNADYNQTFSIIQELGCNFLRLAHYPHPKEVYDRCDALGIIVQTEGPCVNKMQSTMPTDYYDHLNIQYDDMVNQHYNHPCIVFWGLSNETTTDDKAFANTKINGYIARIRALDSSRLIGYVMAQSASDPSGYYNNPNADWFGCNIYEGWYSNPNSNNPTSAINARIRNLITNKSKAMAYSEYGCGGTQRCHSDDPLTTTTRGNYARHDIEYMMWLHEGHIAAIKNYPQLLFTAQWQLFDIAVANRNEGYTVCLDGETATTDDNLRRLNDKGLVERDHITKKDPFYLYKAWWNTTDDFVHICGKDYTKLTDRVIKCYTNDGNSLSLYVNDTFIETVSVTDNIATFTARTFSSGDIIRVDGTNASDTFTF